MVDFRVALSVFRGPLDLLLYLVRKHELDVLDIPIAAITDQYLEYLPSSNSWTLTRWAIFWPSPPCSWRSSRKSASPAAMKWKRRSTTRGRS